MRKLMFVASLALMVSSPAFAGSLENLERERADLVATMLDSSRDAAQRQEDIAGHARRLVDFERMVLRDKTLSGRDTAAVRMAFANDDLTFLVLASGEKKMWIVDHFMAQMGLTSSALEMARRGQR